MNHLVSALSLTSNILTQTAINCSKTISDIANGVLGCVETPTAAADDWARIRTMLRAADTCPKYLALSAEISRKTETLKTHEDFERLRSYQRLIISRLYETPPSDVSPDARQLIVILEGDARELVDDVLSADYPATPRGARSFSARRMSQLADEAVRVACPQRIISL